jgi:predicted NBD/HSP70 family sugar kinase
VDVVAGMLVSDRLRVRTPEPSTPEACIAAIARLVERAVARVAGGQAETAPLGVGIPWVMWREQGCRPVHPAPEVPAPVIPAALRNDAGIIGAAVLASERGRSS